MSSEQNVMNFLHYLGKSDPDLNAVAQYLARSAFPLLKVSACTISRLGQDGYVRVAASFGLTSMGQEELTPLVFGVESPLTKALRSGEVVAGGNIGTFASSHARVLADHFTVPFESSVLISIPQVGVLTIFLLGNVEIGTELQRLLHSYCAILSMHARYLELLGRKDSSAPAGIPGPPGERGPQGATGDTGSQGATGDTGSQGATGDTGSQGSKGDRGSTSRKAPWVQSADDLELTVRQSMIVSSIKRGLTNEQIAVDIGFSVSLIRQETMEIYRKLNIGGRQDLMG